MKNPLKVLAAAALGAATLAAGSASAGFGVYYVDFKLGNTVVGHGFIPCADSPAEYVLVWGSDNGEAHYYGQENCPPFPPPLP